MNKKYTVIEFKNFTVKFKEYSKFIHLVDNRENYGFVITKDNLEDFLEKMDNLYKKKTNTNSLCEIRFYAYYTIEDLFNLFGISDFKWNYHSKNST